MKNILDLNQMEVRPPRELVRIEAIPNENNEEMYMVKTESDFADSTLVVGERYQPGDISSVCSCHLGKFSSGVMSECDAYIKILLTSNRPSMSSFRSEQREEDCFPASRESTNKSLSCYWKIRSRH